MCLYGPLGGFSSFFMIIGVIWIMLKYRKLEKDAQKALKEFEDAKEKARKEIEEKYVQNGVITFGLNDPNLSKNIKLIQELYDNVNITYSKD